MVPRIVKVGRVFCIMFNEKCGAKLAAAKKRDCDLTRSRSLGTTFSFNEKRRGRSTTHDWTHLGTTARVLVQSSPNLAQKAHLWAYWWCEKDFHFRELKFYSLFWVSSAISDHFQTKYCKVGSKIYVHENENPFHIISKPINVLGVPS